MGDSNIRNQSWCRECRRGTAVATLGIAKSIIDKVSENYDVNMSNIKTVIYTQLMSNNRRHGSRCVV